MVRKEISCKYKQCTQNEKFETVAKTLKDLIIACYKQTEVKLNKSNYRLIKKGQYRKADEVDLDDAFDCSINCWTQSTLFMDAISSQTMRFLCFTRSAVQFIKSCMNKSANEWRRTSKSKPTFPIKIDRTWPQPSKSTFSSDESNLKT